MFEAYSERARTAIFVARHKAGQYGAETVDLDHLLIALIYEDQGNVSEALKDLQEFGGAPLGQAEEHQSFLSSGVASDVLQKLDQVITKFPSRPPHVDMPMSTELKHTLGLAHELSSTYKRAQIEPLHLLAAILSHGRSEGARILQQAGITREKVLDAIKRSLP